MSVNSIGTCGLCGYHGPGPDHPCTTRCPHSSKSTPQSCSQCMAAVPKVVRVQDGMVTMDGVTLGTHRELNDQRMAVEAGVRRPVVRDDRTVYVSRGMAASRARGARNSLLRTRGSK